MSNKECKCDIPNYSAVGRCFKCGGFNEGSTLEDPQLPEEMQKRLTDEANAYATGKVGDIQTIPACKINEWEKAADGWEAGTTAYATKLQEAQQEVTRLTNWQQEAKAILNPIWDYADTLKVPLGESKTEAVIKHVKDAKDLLEEVFTKHESGLLPDRFIYEKINKFLYGE